MSRAGGAFLLAVAICLSSSAGEAAVITFDSVVAGQTSFGFDGDGDGVDDVIFSTTDPLGFNVTGPGANQSFIHEPGLEGTALLSPDLRVDFLNGASGSIAFGFALSTGEDGFLANFTLFDASDGLLGSASVPATFSITPLGISSFPEGRVELAFPGIAAYGLFDFSDDVGRHIIDDFEGTFGSTETVPEPRAAFLIANGLLGLLGWRWTRSAR